jgi:hypothetical protein
MRRQTVQRSASKFTAERFYSVKRKCEQMQADIRRTADLLDVIFHHRGRAAKKFDSSRPLLSQIIGSEESRR